MRIPFITIDVKIPDIPSDIPSDQVLSDIVREMECEYFKAYNRSKTRRALERSYRQIRNHFGKRFATRSFSLNSKV